MSISGPETRALTQGDATTSLRDAYLQFRSDLVRSLRSMGVVNDTGTEISQRTRLNRQLSWQLSNIVAEPDVTKGLAALPGKRGLEILVAAASRSPEESSIALARSVSRLETVIQSYTGDRARLSLLTAAWGHDGLDSRSEALRREAYRVQSALYGINATCQVRGAILGPSHLGTPDTLSVASYSYFADLVRYRNDRPFRLLFADIPWKNSGEPAIDVEDMEAHVKQLYQFRPEYSTGTNEQVNITVFGQRGWVTLAPGPLGCSEAVGLGFTGLSKHQSARYAAPDDPTEDVAQIAQFCFVPSEQLVVDVLTTPEIAEEARLEETLSAACFDATGGLPMIPASVHDPAFLYNLDSRRSIGYGTFDIDPASTTLTSLIDESARGLGLRADELVGFRYTTKFALATSLMMITRVRLARPSERMPR